MPSQQATLAAVQPARIQRILFSEGASVKRGEIVVQLEESSQRARTELAKAASESSLQIDLARAAWEHAKRDLDRLMKLTGEDFGSSKELSDALSTEEISRLQYEFAKFSHEQDRRGYEVQEAALEEMRLRAPFDGYLASYVRQPGDCVEQREGIVQLVRLNPLHVVLDCPLEIAPRIKLDQRFRVKPSEASWPEKMGRVVFASRAADGASQTFRVKLEVDNEEQQWVSGLRVAVDFGSPITAMETATPTHGASDERDARRIGKSDPAWTGNSEH